MTLEQFATIVCSNRPEPPKIYVFDNRDSCNDFLTDKTGEVLFVIQSDFIPSFFLQEKWLLEEIEKIYALGEDVFAVVLQDKENSFSS